jgi:hypothetical protein
MKLKKFPQTLHKLLVPALVSGVAMQHVSRAACRRSKLDGGGDLVLFV